MLRLLIDTGRCDMAAARTSDGASVLHILAARGGDDAESIRLCCEAGADVNSQMDDAHGRATPLFIAVALGHRAAVVGLHAKRADVTRAAVDVRGLPVPLMCLAGAAAGGRDGGSIVCELVESSAAAVGELGSADAGGLACLDHMAQMAQSSAQGGEPSLPCTLPAIKRLLLAAANHHRFPASRSWIERLPTGAMAELKTWAAREVRESEHINDAVKAAVQRALGMDQSWLRHLPSFTAVPSKVT